MKRIEVTPEEGRAALHAHLVERAVLARERHGPFDDEGAVQRLLADEDLVRFPTSLKFEEADLLRGEFAWARPRGASPSDGFDLLVHPCFRGRPGVLGLLVGYHLPSVNYLDVVSREEAELFGAALTGLDVDEYYARLCSLADGMPAGPVEVDPDAVALLEEVRQTASGAVDATPSHSPAGGGGCQGGSGPCGCSGGATP